MTNTLEQITKFIATLQEKYPQLKIAYDYDSGEDYYYIKHNNSHLQFYNEEFAQLAGSLIRTCFFNHGIFNISFGYDHHYFKDTNYQMQASYSSITIEMKQANCTTNLFYKVITESNFPLLVNHKTSNITFSFDVTESLESSYNRQAYSTNQISKFNYFDGELRLVS